MRNSRNGIKSSPRNSLTDAENPGEIRRGNRKDFQTQQFVVPRRRGTATIFTQNMQVQTGSTLRTPRRHVSCEPLAPIIRAPCGSDPASPTSPPGQKRTSSHFGRRHTVSELQSDETSAPPQGQSKQQHFYRRHTSECLEVPSPTSPSSPTGPSIKPPRFGRRRTMSNILETLGVTPFSPRSHTVPELPVVRFPTLTSIPSSCDFDCSERQPTYASVGTVSTRPPRDTDASDLESLSDDDSEKEMQPVRRGFRKKKWSTCSTCDDDGSESRASEPQKVKSHQDLDHEFQQLFTENPDWDPQVGVEAPKIIEVDGEQQQQARNPKKPVRRRPSTKYMDALLGAEVVDEIMGGEREKTPEPEEQPQPPKMGLSDVLGNLVRVRQRVRRLRTVCLADTGENQRDLADEGVN